MIDNTTITFSDVHMSLEKLQEIVGGYIRIVKLSDGRTMIVDEEGLLKNKPLNKPATELAQPSIHSNDYIVGNVVVLDKGVFR